MHFFENISLLITHYNRSKSLERLLICFDGLGIQFKEVIVSDDGSNPEHIAALVKLQELYGYTLVIAPNNKGLGNNINKGQDAVTTPLTLYIQEDFTAQPLFVEKLIFANQLMFTDASVDFVRFYAYSLYPHLRPFKEGFSEMIFRQSYFWEGYGKFYLYSDHPHLRRSDFFNKFGRYSEGIKPERCEYNMMMSVLKVGAKAYFYEDYKALLSQINSSKEPSTIKRNFWRNNDTFFITSFRHLYRYLRFNFDLLFFKSKN